MVVEMGKIYLKWLKPAHIDRNYLNTIMLSNQSTSKVDLNYSIQTS